MAEQMTTFWGFINSRRVEIPIIQRDYAQGRMGKEYLRKTFLANIKQALDGELPNDEKKLKLDFVYGSILKDGNSLQPLDGQQRLTTMWLLHWYIALRAGELDENTCSILRNFSYETRISSREFCRNLCVPEHFTSFGGKNIVAFIRRSTWFYSAWGQDPTIQSMLRMLGGTKINDKNGQDITDGLEELFAGKEEFDFKGYWDKLVSRDAPIVFYYQPLEDFGLSDDLYVKMNARGKQLTAFENLKADLIGYMREEEVNAKKEEDKLRWKLLLEMDVEKNNIPIPIKMDTKWLDIFWENKSDNNNVDEIFFAFLNRFFWNELFIAKRGCSEEYVLQVGGGQLPDGKRTNAMENENLSYKHLNGDNCNEYASLTPYRYLDDEIPVQLFEDLQKVLDNYSKYKNSNPQWEIPFAKWMEGFQFIPRYKDDKSKSSEQSQVTTLNLGQRILFFAICKFFKEEEAESEANYISINRWMRVVCNLISGVDETGSAQIRSVEAVRSAIDQIRELDSHDIYRNLCNQQVGRATDFGRRWTEEVHKAKQIINEDGGLRKYEGDSLRSNNSKYENWEDIIIEAEGYAFFHGAIRFLFYDKDGVAKWDEFDIKWGNARKYFKREVSKSAESCLNEEYDSAQLLKVLISGFDRNDFYSVLWWHYAVFNNRIGTWLYYLLNPVICDHIHNLLLGEATDVIQRESSDDFVENTLYLLSNTGLLDYVMDKIPTSWIRGYHYHYAIFPSAKGVFLNAENRDDFLLHTDGIIIDESYKIPNTELLFGSDMYFDYKGRHFQWYRNDFVYLMKDDNRYERLIKDESANEETERRCCFDAGKLRGEEILKEMDKLIDEAVEGTKEANPE